MLFIASAVFFLGGLLFAAMSVIVLKSIGETLFRGSHFIWTVRERLQAFLFLIILVAISASFIAAAFMIWVHPLMGWALGVAPILFLTIQLASASDESLISVRQGMRRCFR